MRRVITFTRFTASVGSLAALIIAGVAVLIALVAAGAGVSLIGIIFGRQICSFYTSDPATLEACLKTLWVILPLNIVANAVNTVEPQLRAGGDSTFVMVVSLIGVWVIRLPLTWLLCFKLDMGVLGLFLGNVATLTFRTTVSMIRFCTNKWMYRKV